MSRRAISNRVVVLKYESKDDCPDRKRLHTPAPSGEWAWYEWAEKKKETHKQERCPTCGFFAVWKPKGDAA